MDNAHNKHGPVFGPVCRVHGNRGAPPGVIEPQWSNRPRDKVSMIQGEVIPRYHRIPVTHRPRDSAARSRAPALWRRPAPGKPASKPVQGEVCPVENNFFNIYIVDYQLFILIKKLKNYLRGNVKGP